MSPTETNPVVSRCRPVVLVVDDEPLVLSTVGRLLDSAGFTTITTATVEEALRAARATESGPDVALVDMTMDGPAPSEFSRQLKEINADIRIVLASGYPLEHYEQDVAEAGADAFIQKPFLRETLEATIREVLGRGRR